MTDDTSVGHSPQDAATLYPDTELYARLIPSI